MGAAALVTVVLFFGVTGYQGSRYHDAGVRDVFWVGAAAGHVFVALLMLGLAVMYQWGFRRRLLLLAASVAVLVAVVLAALPPVVAEKGWLSCLLGALFGVTLPAAFAGWAVLAARYAFWLPDPPS